MSCCKACLLFTPFLSSRHAELVRADWVKPGAVVVDVGINVVQPPPPLTRTTAVPASAPCNSSEVGAENPGLNASGSAPPPPPPKSVQWTPGAYQIVGDVAFDEVCQVRKAAEAWDYY